MDIVQKYTIKIRRKQKKTKQYTEGQQTHKDSGMKSTS